MHSGLCKLRKIALGCRDIGQADFVQVIFNFTGKHPIIFKIELSKRDTSCVYMVAITNAT